MCCPNCKSKLESFDNPEHGEVTICKNCGALPIFSSAKGLTICTEEMELIFRLKHPKHMQTVDLVRHSIAQQLYKKALSHGLSNNNISDR